MSYEALFNICRLNEYIDVGYSQYLDDGI